VSFEIAVWSSSKSFTNKRAGRIYDQFLERRLSSENTPQPDAQERLGAFLAELEQKYPPISSINWTDETIDDCPWSCDFDIGEDYIIMSCVWSRAEEIADFIEELAFRHELVCYDPQSTIVTMPASLGGVPPGTATEEQQHDLDQQRELKRQALQSVEAAIDRELQALGFEKRGCPDDTDYLDGDWVGGLYVREINAETLGLVRWSDISRSDCSTLEVSIEVGVRNQRLEKALAEEWQRTFHPYWPPSLELELGMEIGRTMGMRVYTFKERERDEKVAKQIGAAVRKFAIPFMESHASLAILRARAENAPVPRWLGLLGDKTEYPHWMEERAAVARRLLNGDQVQV
jgi:hypothetical protein